MNITQVKGEALKKLFHSDYTLLVSPDWEELQSKGMFYFQVASANGVVALMSAYSYKKFGKTFLITPPGLPYCGFEIINSPSDDEGLDNLIDDIIASFATYLDTEFSGSYIDLCFPPFIKSLQPFADLSFEMLTGKTYLLDLTQTESDLLKQVSSNRKRNINKASKGYEISFNTSDKDVLALLDFTLQKSQNMQIRPLFEKMLAQPKAGYIQSICILKEGVPIAAGIYTYDKHEYFYFAGGHNSDVGDQNAGTICLWSAIMDAKSKGVSTFNFCGSSIPSIERYFKSFGASPVSYFRIKKGKNWIDKAKTVKKKLFG